MFRLTCLLLLLGVMTPGFPQDAASAVAEREQDVYAVYSVLLTNPKTSHGSDDNERYMIAHTSVAGYPEYPCVVPPKERYIEFRQVLVDYFFRKEIRRELKSLFSIPKPYVLLSDDEVKAFIAERSLQRRVEKPPDERFRGVTDLFRLTDVYFNPSRTLALTALSTYCGGLCGLSEWKVFEKVDGKWEPRQWVVCSSIS